MINVFYLSQTWFSGYDILLEVIFSIITLIVALYSFKVYRLAGQRESKLLGISFLLISISYSLWAILNSFALRELNEAQSRFTLTDLMHYGLISSIGIYGHILLYLTGIITLTYMTLRIKSSKIYSLLICLVLITSFLVEEKYIVIYFLSSILLLFVIIGYVEEYWKNKNKGVLLTIYAFMLLFLGRFDFVFSTSRYIFYVVGHLLELVAYMLILISLLIVIRQGQKKILP